MLSFSSSFAQNKDEKFEKIKAQKVAYITQKVDLTPEEAQQFWPIYNEYESKMFALHKSRKEKGHQKPDIETMSDKELNQLFEDRFTEEEQRIKLKREYHQKFMAILPAKKVALLYEAEFSFRHELLDQLKERRHKPESAINSQKARD